jgi:hypothetical protein
MNKNSNCLHHKMFLFALIVMVLTACSSRDTAESYTSEILYTRLESGMKIGVWILNVDDDKSWKISDDLWPRGWSPSGEKILLDGARQNGQGQIWVSDSDGTNLEKVFDAKDFPEVASLFVYNELTGSSHDSFWLTDDLILVQPGGEGVLLYDIKRKRIKRIDRGAVLSDVSPGGEYWIERQGPEKFLLVSLKSDTPIPLLNYGPMDSAYHISPDGTKIAYSVSRDTIYFIGISEIDREKGIHDEILVAPLPKPIRDFHWSPDQNSLLHKYYDSSSEQMMCIVVELSEGKETYNQPCESRSDVIQWSPRLDGFLTEPHVQKYFFYHFSGEVETILEVSPDIGGILNVVDWRLIETD